MYPSSPLTVPGLCRVGAELVSEREVEVGLSSAAHKTRTARHIVPQDTTRNVQKGSTYIKMQVRLWNHMGRNIRNMSFHATWMTSSMSRTCGKLNSSQVFMTMAIKISQRCPSLHPLRWSRRSCEVSAAYHLKSQEHYRVYSIPTYE